MEMRFFLFIYKNEGIVLKKGPIPTWNRFFVNWVWIIAFFIVEKGFRLDQIYK